MKYHAPSPLQRLVDAWYRSEGLAVPVLIGLFIVAWTIFHVVANASIALHTDTLEMYTWARHPSPGYPQHPPLGALMAAAWFALFPATDWSFHLLMMLNSAVALYAIDLIARRYTTGDKRLLVLLLLLLLPFYQFRGDRFSVNLPLLSMWPIATYCFLRAFESRAVHWSIAAGATAAFAMLGKYYSIYLIAGFVIAALLHQDRRRYLASSSPWVSMAVGFLLLAPHVYWLVTTGFQPLQYALGAHAGADLGTAFAKAGSYLVGAAAYLALPVAVLVLVTRQSPATLARALWPGDARLRMLATLFWVPIVLPVLTAPLFGAVLTPLWIMQDAFLLPIILLAPAAVEVRRASAVGVGVGVLAVTTALILVAPALALIRYRPEPSAILRLDDKDARVYGEVAARRLTDLWRQATGRPLTLVSGGFRPTPYAITFYSDDHPDSIVNYDLAASPWIAPERLGREGWAAVCPSDDRYCIAGAHRLAGAEQELRTVEFDATVTFLGRRRAERFVALLCLPKTSHKPGG